MPPVSITFHWSSTRQHQLTALKALQECRSVLFSSRVLILDNIIIQDSKGRKADQGNLVFPELLS